MVQFLPKQIRKKFLFLLAPSGLLIFSAFTGIRSDAAAVPSPLVESSLAAPPDSMSMVDYELKEKFLQEFRLKAFTDSLISFARSFEGRPYKWGGTGPKGFDCSGYIQYIFEEFGLELNRSSRAQSRQGKEVPTEQLQKGDLVFFTGRNRQERRVGHVGMVVSNPGEEIRFIHSSSNGGVMVSEMEGYYKSRFLFAKRFLGPGI